LTGTQSLGETRILTDRAFQPLPDRLEPIRVVTVQELAELQNGEITADVLGRITIMVERSAVKHAKRLRNPLNNQTGNLVAQA
jgi:hypothetical protein